MTFTPWSRWLGEPTLAEVDGAAFRRLRSMGWEVRLMPDSPPAVWDVPRPTPTTLLLTDEMPDTFEPCIKDRFEVRRLVTASVRFAAPCRLLDAHPTIAQQETWWPVTHTRQRFMSPPKDIGELRRVLRLRFGWSNRAIKRRPLSALRRIVAVTPEVQTRNGWLVGARFTGHAAVDVAGRVVWLWYMNRASGAMVVALDAVRLATA